MAHEAEGFVDFLNSCGSPYHAADAAARLLHGAQQFDRVGAEEVPTYGYHIYYGSTVIGWRRPASGRIRRILIMGSHTDSPCLRTRPQSRLEDSQHELLGVDTYGGGLWHSWLDRACSLAGQIHTNDGGSHLVRLNGPAVIIPNLCIHYRNESEREAFRMNYEDHLRPLVAMKPTEVAGIKAESEPVAHWTGKNVFSESLLRVIAEEHQIDPESINSWDLCLYDSTPARLAGIKREFVDSPGLDNRSSLYANFRALEQIAEQDLCPDVLVIAVGFDHEEVGSESTRGAQSNLLLDWIKLLDVGRSLEDMGQRVAIQQNSIILSCDAAHAVHPNYPERHQAQHKPIMGQGVVIKMNANQRYATTAHGLGICRQLAEQFRVPIQEMSVRNDSRCGGTIGPMSASLTGIETVDCGVPMLAMHSARELCHSKDIEHLIDFCLCWAKTM